jgi:hypothetical protein
MGADEWLSARGFPSKVRENVADRGGMPLNPVEYARFTLARSNPR